MRRTINLATVWTGPLFFVLYLLAFGVIAGYLPPPSPSLTANEVVQLFTEDGQRIRFGLILGMIFCTLMFGFFGAFSVQIARIEGRVPILAMLQFGAAVLLIVFFFVCHMLWIAMTFRDYSAPAMQQMNDLAWLIFVMVFPTYVLQMICIALAAFMDTEEQAFPRWYGWFCLWVGISGSGGAIAVYFKSGPLAWNGVIGFWIPIVMFAIWLCASVPVLLRAVHSQFDQLDAADAAAA
ncbi:hypothetical protein ACIRON_16795 [Nocardioides sp. NPDC101246]|uniref:hypothetical protein n=1 Tax=Nocardioides sp. NPDC101246 TaxID=3364336 RepID=UPI003800E100